MITQPQKQMLTLATVLIGIISIIVIQSYFLFEYQEKNKTLTDTLDLLESNMEEEQKKNQFQYDSLQSEILLQIVLQDKLQEELSIMEKTRAEINRKSDENKTSILRIHAVDSLRDVVSRHYRR